MTQPRTRLTLAWLLMISFVLSYSAPARADNGVTFTLTVKSAFLRNAPSMSAPRIYSIFLGQVYPITGRNADSSWLQISFPDAATAPWIMTVFGEVHGDLGSVPILAAAPAPGAPSITEAPPTTGADTPPTNAHFTITTKSTFAHSAPSLSSLRIASLFQGQTYAATARTGDVNWIQITYGGGSVWVLSGVGRLNLNLLNLPVIGNNFSTPPGNSLPVTPDNTTRPPLPEWIPVITQHMRQIYDQSSLYGNNVNAFALAGDCNSQPYVYLERLAGGLFDLTPYGYLISTKDRFYPAFLRSSVAVQGGFGAFSMFDPLWANPKQCNSDEGPFACELRVTRASIVFIALGTGDHLVWPTFEANYRKLIEYALKRGVLPVLVTKADTLESQESNAPPYYIDSVIRRLGTEYEVPVLDLELATKDLPNHGLRNEGGHDFHQSALGMEVHILTTLQTLDVIWH